MTLDKRDQSVSKLFAEETLTGDEPVLQRLATRTSAVALDRWGVDLERDAGEQQWSAFRQVVEETATDVLAYYADESADVEGVDAPVFEGRPISTDPLVDATLEVVEIVESEVPEADRDAPGGLVEPVESEGSA